MKKALLTCLFLSIAIAAFSQGKVSFQNDGGSPIVLNGQPIPTTGPLPSGIVVIVGLYGGTSSTSLTLQTTVLLNAGGVPVGSAPGVFPMTHCITSFPGGAMDYFQVAAWDSSYLTPWASVAAGSLGGWDNIFTMTPGTSIAFPSILNGGNSTWFVVGNETPLEVGIPEPSVCALVVAGLACFVFKRRESKLSC